MRIALMMATFILTVIGCNSKPTMTEVGDDQSQIQGKWRVVSAQRSDKKPVAKEFADASVRIDGDQWSYVVANMVKGKYKLVLEPGKTPKQIDMKPLNKDGKVVIVKEAGPNGELEEREAVFAGIYELDGDHLKISAGFFGPFVPRPASFDSKELGILTLVLERVK